MSAFIQLVLLLVGFRGSALPSRADEIERSHDALQRVGHYCRFSSYGQSVQTRNNQMHVDGIRSEEPLYIKSVIGAEPTSEDSSILLVTREISATPYTLQSDPTSCRRVDARTRSFEAKLINKNRHELLLYLRAGETVEVQCQELKIHICEPGGR